MIYQFIDVANLVVVAVLTAYVATTFYVLNESKNLK